MEILPCIICALKIITFSLSRERGGDLTHPPRRRQYEDGDRRLEWKGKVKLHLKWICQSGRWRCELLCYFQWTHIFGDAWDKFGNDCILILCFMDSSAGKPWLTLKVGRNRRILLEQHSILWAPSKVCAENNIFHLSDDSSIKNSFSFAQDKELETIWHAGGFVIQY